MAFLDETGLETLIDLVKKPATKTTSGPVKIGDNIDVNAAGTISVPLASTTTPGVIKIGTGLVTATDGTVSVSSDISGASTAEEVSYVPSINAPEDVTNLQLAVDDIYAAIADINYKAVTLSSFSITPSVAEMGSTVSSVTATWAYSQGTPVSQVLTPGTVSVPVGTKTYAFTGQSLTANTSFAIKATDARDATSSKSATLSFVNGVYYGVSATLQEGLTNAIVTAFTKNLRSSHLSKFTVNAAAGQYIYYACPARFSAPTFSVGGFAGGFESAYQMSITNASGYTETYNVYRSSNHSLGSVTVDVA